jgi:hypothetical protein
LQPNTRYTRLIIVLVLLTAVVFETFQQLYYVRRFQLGDDITFWAILKGQSFRWLIWLLLSVVLVWYARQQAAREKVSPKLLVRHTLLIVGLVALNILIIAVLQLAMNQDPFTWRNLIGEYLPFYTFQKAPVYLLGYIGIAIILHLYFAKEQLQVEFRELTESEQQQAERFRQLKQKINDQVPVLNIKIGNKRRIIPVADINWIEADDYCVKVHTVHQGAYTMRSSLKALENRLKGDFVRVHRKAIVNMAMVKTLLSAPEYCLLLNDGTEVPVAKSKLKRLRDRFQLPV